VILAGSRGADAGAVTQSQRSVLELVCPCGITFEPLPSYDPDADEPVCDSCADVYGGRFSDGQEPWCMGFLRRLTSAVRSEGAFTATAEPLAAGALLSVAGESPRARAGQPVRLQATEVVLQRVEKTHPSFWAPIGHYERT
jgi:hypothetical protein